MSESILKALMQLFAIIARPDSDEGNRRPLVKDFLKQQLTTELVEEYLIIFDNYYHKHQKRQTHKNKKGLASSSVRVLTICTLINKELTLKQKIIVVIRLLEFINSEGKASEQEFEFVKTVAETFNISYEEYQNLIKFIFDSYSNIPDLENVLVIDGNKYWENINVKHLFADSLDGQILVYHCEPANMHVFVYHGKKELYLNGLIIHEDRVYVLSSGSAIRDSKKHPVYYSDIVSAFNDDSLKSKIIFEAENVSYKFKSGAVGVQKTSFTEKSGKLVGIMGASGSGKSTLLNILNGSIDPTTGKVLINGIDVHLEKEKLEGIIGYVSQDDLLMEDLTVFENLYYNAKLCFSKYTHFQILRIVVDVLKNLGLYEIKNMKVGSPLNKKISGGQRKRLNIALELLREPSVLFLDEPTSGLSSRDSERILDLLKELSLKGKLIFVVIHQPSSDIFKMFDRLIILDIGGYLAYDGDPVDSIVYFKSRIKQADWSESECHECGNVNAEQIFDILEANILDEYGKTTSTRKYKPVEWYKYFYQNKEQENEKKNRLVFPLPEISFKIPGWFKQFIIFVQRDFLSKTANTQYLFINLLEAPLLAFLLSYIIKYYNISAENELGYVFNNNNNLPVYIFMSVIVGLFIGLTTSADEIIKDRKILKRESFLNLSRSSYLSSKIFILFVMAAYQAITYTLIGNYMMEIKGMYWEYWIVLFSTWAFSILMGLNISDGFKTSITIYIIIPFLIIPQIILSGIIVRYDELNPKIVTPGSIPWFGEIITARWSYEALAVNQFTDNEFDKPIFKFERIKYYSNYKKDLWLKTLSNKVNNYERNKNNKLKKEEIETDLLLLRNEVSYEISTNLKVKTKINIENLYVDKISEKDIDMLKDYFVALKTHYISRFADADRIKNEIVNKFMLTDELKEKYTKLKRDCHNESLEELLTNKNELKKTIEFKGHLYPKTDMIYHYPEKYIVSHFYSPKKRFFDDKYYGTLYFNVVVIWIYTILLYLTLYFGLLKNGLNFFAEFKLKFKNKRKIDSEFDI
jgi:ABC-type multidrug transport system ATPase subunit